MSATVSTESRVRFRARGRLTWRKLLVTLAVLLALLIVFGAIALAIGSERVDAGTIVRVIASEITGRTLDVSPEHTVIIASIRLPRVLMAMTVGAALAVAGAAYQALLRNPLADPGILGVSSGAALGAIAATIFVDAVPVSRPVAAFVGAGATIAIVYALGQSRQGGGAERLILAGVIINALLSSIVIFLVTTAAGARQRSVLSWLIGDLSGEARLLPVVALFVLIGVAAVYLNARNLNLLMTGEDDALALGVEIRRVKATVYLAASLLTGAAVAVSGAIGFVGLIIPHAVRLAGGSDNRLVIPASAFAGATFLVLADTLARTVIAPRELNIGVVTALVGAPVFIYLLRRTS
ncbi:MAG TPA: iron ABC transporter permease [Blastocatellia bacterium]|nr:iron ABC transporter permease [Blastocatellia bacterium]